MKLRVNVLQGVRSAAIFEVQLLDAPLVELRKLIEFEQWLNVNTDHRWHLTILDEK